MHFVPRRVLVLPWPEGALCVVLDNVKQGRERGGFLRDQAGMWHQQKTLPQKLLQSWGNKEPLHCLQKQEDYSGSGLHICKRLW